MAIETMLADFQLLVYGGIERAIAQGATEKTWDGQIALTVDLPSYASRKEKAFVQLSLHAFVFGPEKHYTWTGHDVALVFEDATREVQTWIDELDED